MAATLAAPSDWDGPETDSTTSNISTGARFVESGHPDPKPISSAGWR